MALSRGDSAELPCQSATFVQDATTLFPLCSHPFCCAKRFRCTKPGEAPAEPLSTQNAGKSAPFGSEPQGRRQQEIRPPGRRSIFRF